MIKVLTTRQLKRQDIFQICNLKNTYWRFSLDKQIQWFQKNIKNDDIHFCYFKRQNIVAYNSLRKSYFIFKEKKRIFFLFDTFLIHKNFRKIGLAKKMMNQNLKLLKKSKKIGFLLCQKKHINFYKKLKWKYLKNQNYKLNIFKKKNLHIMFINFSKLNFNN